MTQFLKPTENKSIISIDLGATWVRFARIDPDGHIAISRHPTPPGHEAEERIRTAFRSLVPELDAIGTICIARAPTFNDAGIVTEWPNRPDWVGVHFFRALTPNSCAKMISHFDDGECFAAWEYISGCYRRDEVVATIGIGTGVAVGIVKSGFVIHTGDGASTLGHRSFGDAKVSCTCGRSGCVQAILALKPGDQNVKALIVKTIKAASAWLKVRYDVSHIVFSGGRLKEIAPLIKGLPGTAGDLPTFSYSRTPKLSALAGAAVLSVGGRRIEHHRCLRIISIFSTCLTTKQGGYDATNNGKFC